jgi:hypothetical protein
MLCRRGGRCATVQEVGRGRVRSDIQCGLVLGREGKPRNAFSINAASGDIRQPVLCALPPVHGGLKFIMINLSLHMGIRGVYDFIMIKFEV